MRNPRRISGDLLTAVKVSSAPYRDDSRGATCLRPLRIGDPKTYTASRSQSFNVLTRQQPTGGLHPTERQIWYLIENKQYADVKNCACPD